jgi:hypothetical protein
VERWAKLDLLLDRYAETPIFACLECSEESLKVSVPVNLAHCTACGFCQPADRLAVRLEQRRQSAPVERFDMQLGRAVA